MKYRPDIDGLRALAVLCVVFFHVGIPGFRGGFIGVDVFFVISGFLITRKLFDEFQETGRINFVTFYVGRIRRLYPALVTTVAISLVAGTLLHI